MSDEMYYDDSEEQFDFDTEVNNVRFGLMMNYRYDYDKRYEKELRRIKTLLKKLYPDSTTDYINKIIEKIVLTAERTIDRKFFEAIGKPQISMR